jgi:hypothetical protein
MAAGNLVENAISHLQPNLTFCTVWVQAPRLRVDWFIKEAHNQSHPRYA